MKGRLNMNGYSKKQSGAVLIIGLIILLLLTIIMITALRVTALEERMASNAQNRNVAFQAAESALREAEAIIQQHVALNPQVDWDGNGSQEPNPFRPFKMTNGYFQNTSDPVCWQGLCGTTDPAQSEAFKAKNTNMAASDFHTEVGSRTATTGITGLAVDSDGNFIEPEFIIEYVADEPDTTRPNQRYIWFRITARAWGPGNSVQQLESIYKIHARNFSH